MSNIRIGREYTFDTSGTDSEYMKWDGQKCTVLRALTEKEADIADVGPMWRIRFNDERGTETDAFDDELYGPYRRKLLLMTAGDANAMIADLGAGVTDNGDRKSQYFKFATVEGRLAFVSVALIEDKVGLPESDWGYALHVLNDIDELDGYFLTTQHLDAGELFDLLDQFAFELDHGRR